MKKIVMIAVMAVAAISANAQSWIGGSLGFSTEKVDGADKATNTVSIKPEIGTSIGENWDVAVALSYAYNSAAKTNAFSVNPYVRYTFAKSGNFSAFIDGGVGYTTTHIQGEEKNKNVFGVGFNPGVALAVSQKVTLVAHVGDLSYSHTWKGEAKVNKFNLDLTNNISFGAYYNF